LRDTTPSGRRHHRQHTAEDAISPGEVLGGAVVAVHFQLAVADLGDLRDGASTADLVVGQLRNHRAIVGAVSQRSRS